MTTKGRSSGTRARRTRETTIERAPAPAPEAVAEDTPAAPGAEAQLLDDVATPLAGQPGLRLGRSFAGAVFGTMLVVGLTLGAALGPGGALGPSGERPGDDTSAVAANGAGHGDGSDTGDGKNATGGGDGEDGAGGGGDGGAKGGDWTDPEASSAPDGGDGPDATKDPGDLVDPTEKPVSPEPTKKPAPDPTKKPAPDPTPKPTEKPDPTNAPDGPIALELAIREYHPKLGWGSCDGLDFDYYKVVRSTDSTASWPAGDHDEVIAAVEQGGDRRAYDKYAPHGVKVWYRVFCVHKTDAGYRVVNASPTKGIEVPEEPAPPPPPDPISLELEFALTDEGKVVLGWSACEVDGFAFYKVVKSTWNEDPRYMPWTDGTEVIAAISDLHATEWHDWAPESGETAFYRVQCLGYVGDHKVVLGESAVVAVTTP